MHVVWHIYDEDPSVSGKYDDFGLGSTMLSLALSSKLKTKSFFHCPIALVNLSNSLPCSYSVEFLVELGA